MIQSVFILNRSGDIIIEKHYRGLISRNVCETFWNEVSKANGKPEEVHPIMNLTKYLAIHILREDLCYLAIVAKECSPLLVIEFLQRLHEVFGTYFGQSVTEASVRENFVIVYQVMDLNHV